MGSSYSPAPTGGPAGRPRGPAGPTPQPSGGPARPPRRPLGDALRRRSASALLAAAGAAAVAAAGLAGCAASRTVVITATPADAAIAIDGVRQGTGSVTAKLRFRGDATHTVVVSRPGYADQTVTLDRSAAAADPSVQVDLKPRTKRVTFDVRPLPAIVKVDGRPVGDGARVTKASAELSFAVDAKNDWVPHVVSAERPGYRRAERTVRFTDPSDAYALTLEPERKDVVITTDPPGADVTIDDEPYGKSPATVADLVIRTDPQTNEWIGRKIRATKPGYEPAERTLSWDDKRSDYALKLGVKAKTARVTTDPPDAVVRLGDKVLERDATGTVTVPLTFPPTNEQGDLPTHALTVSPPVGNVRRDAARFSIGWDDGKGEYTFTLPAAPTRPTPLVRAAWAKAADGGWRMLAESVKADGPVRTDEGPGVWAGRVLGPPAGGGVIDALATSPDGSLLAYAVVSAGGAGGELRSRIEVVSAELPARGPAAGGPGTRTTAAPATRPTPRSGVGQAATTMTAAAVTAPAKTPTAAAAPVRLTADGAVALMPSFSPDGGSILFADSRDGGRTVGVYELPVPPALSGGAGGGGEVDAGGPHAGADGVGGGDGAPEPKPLTAGAPADLWPTLDSAPQPRVYVQAVGKAGGIGELTAVDPSAPAAAGAAAGADNRRVALGQTGGQPRVSPRADAIVFTRPDPKTGRRDLFLLRMGSDEPTNLTNSPDDDDFDPVWSKDGSRLAFASDRLVNPPPAVPAATPTGAAGAAGRDGRPPAGPARDLNIWVVGTATGDKPRRVTSNPAWDDNPAWGGDDTVLFFRSNRGGEWAVWAVGLK